ncbi:DMT family transporter [Mailhella massiliensis]|uniref:DMT family transporter n=1 Tax=Mailhella massiliensis TaxID=1903261 RepID=UPI00097DDF24|nr:EamA family transporter [Mailhella massiliensis]
MQGKQVSRLKACLCLALLYLSWGGSFLGMKFALTGFPPVAQNGIRLCGAGLLMLALLPLTKHGRPTGFMEIVHYFVLAFFVMFMNNVCQAVGQQSVPSGMTALLYGAVPLFMVLGDWLVLRGPRPGRGQTFAIGGAMLGMAVLTFSGGAGVACPLSGMLVILLGVVCFVAGSLYAKRFLADAGMSLYGGMALTMLFGGLLSLPAAWLMGESFDVSGFTAASLGGMMFLTFFTSVLGYLCYYWLLAHTRVMVAVSFAYIDPVIAVILGALFGSEALSPGVLASCVLIVGSVMGGLYAGSSGKRRSVRER